MKNHSIRNAAALFTLAAFAVTAPALAGKRNDPNIVLQFTPTTAIGETAPPSVSPGTAVFIEVQDGRRTETPEYLGTRTDDDDNKYTLQANRDVAEFVSGALRTAMSSWGIPVRDDAPNRLLVKVDLFRVHETNQPVGASYEAEVRLIGRMERADGSSGEIHKVGDSTRYGKKFSNANINEVLSDALLEAFAVLLDEPRLWKATPVVADAPKATPAAPAAAAATGEALTPEGVLERLLQLQSDGFADATIAAFLKKQTLTRSLTAEDLRQWKAEGAKQTWMQHAMELAVR